jgi:hypothetical protein
LSHQTRELLEMMSGKKGEGNEQNSDWQIFIGMGIISTIWSNGGQFIIKSCCSCNIWISEGGNGN